ncbi:outer membrane efflux protein (plasmid) [Azospirillum sp. B510]|uniref:TolC family protein n=1 Tax=Azospirillum sp. (strain B510) TaxID=137722 RepID=UPI0001C4CAA4|nr:TolC family protein [Azospirillum sp. B510]BAI74771.1 outer membrane efflux protein [Azospirillum sp. B510]
MPDSACQRPVPGRPAARLFPVVSLAALLLLAPLHNPAARSAQEAAESVRPLLERLIAENHRIAAARSGQEAAEAGLRKARAGWYGDVSLSVSAGRESQRNPSPTPATAGNLRDAGVTLRQPLLDFGRIGGEIEKATLTGRQAEATLRDTTQEVLLDGLSALVNLARTRQVVELSQQSLRNIERQTGLEESRVELGGGYATDVLQAKSQLAGARARLVRAKGAHVAAINHYRTVFHGEPPAKVAMVTPLPKAMPTTLDEAIALARGHSPQLEIAGLGADIAKAEVRRVRGAELMPRVEAVADVSSRHNVGGTMGTKNDQTYKVQVTLPFNLGLAPLHSIDAAQASARASASQLDERRLSIDEQVANAWQNLDTARETAVFFENQARIAAEFLRLAREERQQGRRSLLDVLTGETSLYNAQADAASAAGDVSIAALTLLRTAGLLDLSALP